MTNSLFLFPIASVAALWLYILTRMAPGAANTSASITFPQNLQELKDLSALVESFYKHNCCYVILLFCSAYLYKQAFIIPGSVLLNLLAGALFGVVKGFILVCLLTAVGASTCYLLARTFGTSLVQYYFPSQLEYLEEKVKANANELVYYLLFLRLFPMSPNWLINILSPMVGVPLPLFFITALIGLMPYNYICVQAGGVLASIQSLDSLFSVKLMFQLVSMVLPIIPIIVVRRSCKLRDRLEAQILAENKKTS